MLCHCNLTKSANLYLQILFNEHKRAIGVQFDRFNLNHVVFARKEVILSGGSINSPHLLLLSGVGPAQHLHQMGVSIDKAALISVDKRRQLIMVDHTTTQIPVVADLPVGLNLQDHIYPGGIHFSINKPVSLTQKRIFTAQNLIKYFTKGTGEFGLSFLSISQAKQLTSATKSRQQVRSPPPVWTAWPS